MAAAQFLTVSEGETNKMTEKAGSFPDNFPWVIILKQLFSSGKMNIVEQLFENIHFAVGE